jgi:3-phosphoshikimate 1-carboxyvinyltransferase
LSTINLQWTQWKNGEIRLPDSKSWWNRYYTVKALSGQSLSEPKIYQADDVHRMYDALTEEGQERNVGGAGTGYRFMTSFLALKAMETGKSFRLDGNEQMKGRPIRGLVEPLQLLGAKIEYLGKAGYPPLLIHPSNIQGGRLQWNNQESSQFISSLMMIAPYLQNGLDLRWTGPLVSVSYIDLTQEIMEGAGAQIERDKNKLTIKPTGYTSNFDLRPQADWSSAAFWLSALMLRGRGSVTLKSLHPNTLQGDERLLHIFKSWGLQATDTQSGLHVALLDRSLPDRLDLDLSDAPDLVPTVAATCVGLRVAGRIKGIGHLRFKESNRLEALSAELSKWGAAVEIGSDRLQWGSFARPEEDIVHETYGDHRMAMAFAPLSQVQAIRIKDPEVVSKSYPLFWEEGHTLGLNLLQ